MIKGTILFSCEFSHMSQCHLGETNHNSNKFIFINALINIFTEKLQTFLSFCSKEPVLGVGNLRPGWILFPAFILPLMSYASTLANPWLRNFNENSVETKQIYHC